MSVARVIYFRAHEQDIVVRATMGEAGPKITSGYGGWVEVERAKRVSVTEWRGGSPYRMQIPILLDGFDEDRSVEGERSGLERMARTSGGNQPPPVIKVSMPGNVPRTSGVDWVIENIEWGDEYRRIEDGHRVRIWATVDLLQYVEPDTIEVSKAKRRKKKKGGRKKKKGVRIYVVKRGDTLKSIAARLLGDPKRWREIAKLNNIRDPKNIRVGQRLKIPKK